MLDNCLAFLFQKNNVKKTIEWYNTIISKLKFREKERNNYEYSRSKRLTKRIWKKR